MPHMIARLYEIQQERWSEIYQANKNIIVNPRRIYAGQVMIIRKL